MMREIKFRAWDEKNKEWNGECLLDDNGASLRWSEGSESLYELDNIIIEMFTGLYDSEKQEIYEGDILESARGYRYLYNMGYIGEIKYREHFADYEYGEFGGQLTQAKTKYCRVRGNIHVNPELMDVAK